jgi:predicted site-specific integrase-resolvase
MAYVTSREVVQSRGISHRTLLRMIETGEIVPAQKLPTRTGAYLFDPQEVERAFAARDAKHGQDDTERVSA